MFFRASLRASWGVDLSDRKATTRAFAEAIARRTRPEALANGEAVVVGNRAGIVEWAGDAWPRLTGFPLAETLDKPITHFLAQAGLEVGLVDFVAQHFLEGRSCTVALPFDTLDGRTLDVQLDVEPLRDEDGEISRFVAVVREANHPAGPEVTPSEPLLTQTSRDSSFSIAEDEKRTFDAPLSHESKTAALSQNLGLTCSLQQVVRDAIEHFRSPLMSCLGFESIAPKHLIDTIEMDPTKLTAILYELLTQACADENRFVTIAVGALNAERSHHSEVHPIPQRAVAARKYQGVFLEVHDSGAHYSPRDLRRLRSAETPTDPALSAWVKSRELADAAGCTLHFESTPGCGNQALLVLEPCPEPSSADN
jgi:hypothetical protein